MFENEVNNMFASSLLQFSRQPRNVFLSPHREQPLS